MKKLIFTITLVIGLSSYWTTSSYAQTGPTFATDLPEDWPQTIQIHNWVYGGQDPSAASINLNGSYTRNDVNSYWDGGETWGAMGISYVKTEPDGTFSQIYIQCYADQMGQTDPILIMASNLSAHPSDSNYTVNGMFLLGYGDSLANFGWDNTNLGDADAMLENYGLNSAEDLASHWGYGSVQEMFDDYGVSDLNALAAYEGFHPRVKLSDIIVGGIGASGGSFASSGENGGGGGDVIVDQAQQLNIGLEFNNGQWTPVQ